MSAARDASFRQEVRTALKETLMDFDDPHTAKFATTLANHLLMNLHERGLAIHDPANCVRVPWQERERAAGARQTGQDAPNEYGREMTLDEQIAVGLVSAADDVP